MWKFATLFFLIFSLNVFGLEPVPGKFFYTVQVASFKERSKAQEVLRKFKNLPYARISYRNGRYKVRIGFFKSFSNAEQFVKEKLKGKVRDYYITKIRFYPEDVFFAQTKTSVKSESLPSNEAKKRKTNSLKRAVKFENRKKEVNSTTSSPSKKKQIPENVSVDRNLDEQILKEAQKELEKTQVLIENNTGIKTEEQKELKSMDSENKPKSSSLLKKSKTLSSVEKNKNGHLFHRSRSGNRSFWVKVGISGLVLFVLLLIFFVLKRKKGAPSKDLEELIAELLEEERCGELLETVLPALSSQPDNTFLRKAAADCYVKSGKFLEAASLYEEIAEILNRKGLSVLAGEFKKRADELYGKEFKRRG